MSQVEQDREHKIPRRVRHRHTGRAVWRLLIGRPLKSSEAKQVEITPVEGLPSLSLDALSSVAYGPQAIVVVLGLAGVSALHFVFPITLAIIGLLVLLVVSYRQVIEGYPNGGGAYAVSRANLGHFPSLLAASSLIVDYILTVAVSISAGIVALGAAFPAISNHQTLWCVIELFILMMLNLRGLGDTARAFLLPSAVFILGMFGALFIGLIHPLAPHIHIPGRVELPSVNLEPLGILLILKAFSSGCSALTGIEAIANGVPLFREPRKKRAKQTELMLGVLLGSMLLLSALLVDKFHIVPHVGQTILSETLSYSIGRGWAYYVVTLSVTVVLGLAANTSFGGLPVLASALSRDHCLPHAFGQRGNRLVYSRGIYFLAFTSAIILVLSRSNTNTLIPMYAIGVFVGFTLAQVGMVLHWRLHRPARWQLRALVNGLGGVVTFVTLVIFLISKFMSGAWVIVIVIPIIMIGFQRIHRYYARAADLLGIGSLPEPPIGGRTLVVVPIAGVSRAASYVLGFALSISEHVMAVSVRFQDESEELGETFVTTLSEQWERWDPGVGLVVIPSQYHSVAYPIAQFIEALDNGDYEHVVVLIPVIRPLHWRHRALHNQMDLALTSALREMADVAVIRLPILLENLPAVDVPKPISKNSSPRAEIPEADVKSSAVTTVEIDDTSDEKSTPNDDEESVETESKAPKEDR